VARVTQSDGGRYALAGFLYQVVGVLGLRAMASCRPATDGDDELDALISVLREGRIEHERFGQDAVLSQVLGDGEGLCLVQFKFSLRSPPPAVGPKEFNDIVATLVKSRRLAEAEDEVVTKMVLLTNRPDMRRAERRRGRRRGVVVRVIPDVWPTHWLDMLTGFARDFGCRGTEVEDGINRLIGFVHRRTLEAGRAAIETEHLVEAFTHSASSKPLTRDHLKPTCKMQIAKFTDELMGSQGQAVRREILDRLDAESTRSALVVLEGTGGNGKSTALATWAGNALAAAPSGPGALIGVWQASQIETCWVRGLICDYAEIPREGHARRSERAEVAIDRLAVANPDCPHPVLLLGLDGLDEGANYADREREIRETLVWFRDEDERAKHEGRPPIATLVVTCRESRQVFEEWIDPGVSGFPPEATPPQTLVVGDFTDAELLEAVRLGAPDLYPAFDATIAAAKVSSRGWYDDIPSVDDLVRAPALIGIETLGSLRHPVVWRALLRLPRETQGRVLSGDPDATRELARVFTDWFCSKARKRRLKDLSKELILEVLTCISTRSGGPGAKDYQSGWYEPAFGSGAIGPPEIRPLFNEAVSAGYIQEEVQTRWRWRHLMCPDYLSSLRTTARG
jgi:hypothetical protein